MGGIPSGLSAFGRMFPELATSSPHPVRILPSELLPQDTGVHKSEFWSVWDGIATSYARCALSKDSDRVIALSGITKKLGELVKDTCVTGLWAQSMERQLTWHRWGSSLPKPCIQVAPTWSWLSTYGSIYLGYVCSVHVPVYPDLEQERHHLPV